MVMGEISCYFEKNSQEILLPLTSNVELLIERRQLFKSQFTFQRR